MFNFFSRTRLISGSFFVILLEHNGGVAQLVRALACHARGREFKSRRSRHAFYYFLLILMYRKAFGCVRAGKILVTHFLARS